MDKEIKAKIEEIQKARDKRELSLDELDKINGGVGIDDLTAAEYAYLNGLVYKYQKALSGSDEVIRALEEIAEFINLMSEKYHWGDYPSSELTWDR